ncbi:hypothetical protein ALQ45_200237 [Pseudomonas amygdali pv. morsprunorum]|nr:hypothetical protein ALQ45_200237 [Pseudomonas amygdali pv. morsprunorum]
MDHGSIDVFGPLCRAVAHWVEGVIDTFAKPITHADKPTGIVIAVLDPVAISRGDLQQIANFVVGILSRRRVYRQAGKPALRSVAERCHHSVWVGDALRIAVTVKTGKRIDLTQRVGHSSKVALSIVCVPSDVIYVSACAVDTCNLPEGGIRAADGACVSGECQPGAGNPYHYLAQERNGHAQILEIENAHRDVLCRVSSRP